MQGGHALALCELGAQLQALERTHAILNKALPLDSWSDLWHAADDRLSLAHYHSKAAKATAQVFNLPCDPKSSISLRII